MSKMLGKGSLAFIASLFLWINMAVGSPEDSQQMMPEDFEQMTSMTNKLSTSLDFSQLVYGKITKMVGVSFWWKPGDPQGSQLVEAHTIDVDGPCFEIKCGWEQGTAAVSKCSVINGNQASEIYKITNHDKKTVCLMRVDEANMVSVIMMCAYTGAFMRMSSMSTGEMHIPDIGAWVGYGTCRN
jgi:hypothetical protein